MHAHTQTVLPSAEQQHPLATEELLISHVFERLQPSTAAGQVAKNHIALKGPCANKPLKNYKEAGTPFDSQKPSSRLSIAF